MVPVKKSILVQDILGMLNRLCPSQLAEDWDNVGLQVGNPVQAVERVMVALDPTFEALQAACEAGCQLLVTHHPLIFRPLKQVLTSSETGRIVETALKAGISILAAHTNLDRAAEGLNAWLAQRLGLVGGGPLEQPRGQLLKLVVYVPASHAEQVAQALFGAGAGVAGRYDCCSFRVPGQGTFRPGPGSNPFIGETGKLETVEEIRLELVVTREASSRVLQRLLKVHPYEEVAYDLLPLENARNDIGLGWIGELSEEVPFEQMVMRVKQALAAPLVRVAGARSGTVRRVAVCGGSGMSLFKEALRRGADLLVTGDVKYHEARDAEIAGMAVIDAGHFYTERIVVEYLAAWLRDAAGREHLPLQVLEMRGEHDPFDYV
ncbi:MAG: Nif3-like dinuclear metal center hexameric protein [Deltaproteobacteria bacterium]|nr:Nif3-like dinuclear metal center hexameric protein [Deltaproteobacteria bacterium]